MKTLQIRNVPEDIHAELRVRAARAGMSLSDYALAQLERVAAKPPVAEVLERARKRSETISSREAVDLIRAGRDNPD